MQRVSGHPSLLDDALDIRRLVIRYDRGIGVPVYHIRLAQAHLSIGNGFSHH